MSMTEVPVWTLQERLAKAREHAHLDRFQMADKLGVSERTIRNWERGRIDPSRSAVIAYSAVTRVPVEWFTGEYPGEMFTTATYTTERQAA